MRKRIAGHMALMPRAVTRYRRDVPILAINRCPRNLAIRREVWWVRRLVLLCHRLLRNAIFPKEINRLTTCAQKY